MLALFVVRPFLSEALVHFILAFVGGIMVMRSLTLSTNSAFVNLKDIL